MHPECNCAGSFSHDADGKDAKDEQPIMIILRIMETNSFPCQERIILSYLQTTFLTAYSAGQFVLPFFKRSVARLGVAQPCITHLNCAKRPKSSGMILSALRTNEKGLLFAVIRGITALVLFHRRFSHFQESKQTYFQLSPPATFSISSRSS